MDFLHIDKVGLELEGGWPTRPGAFTNVAWHPDASVRLDPGFSGAIGECTTRTPMETWDSVAAWITTNYPVAHNHTCGLHVHVSFKSPVDYARLMTPEFYDYFLTRMGAWGRRAKLNSNHKFWTRLEGLNRYCQKVFNPDEQARANSKIGARYAHLNYCFTLHGTIECRLLPVFTKPSIAVSAVQEILSCYEEYLHTTTPTDVTEIAVNLA